MNMATFWSEGWTAALVNHLWQSTVFVGAAWLLAWALRKNHARVRYCVWMAASVEFLLPLSLLIAAGEWLRSLIPAPVARPAIAAAMEQVTQPFAQTEFFGATTAPVAAHHVSLLPVLLMAVWVCGALVVVGQFARGWWRVHAAKRAAVITNNRRSFVAGAPQDDNGTKLLDSGRGPLKLAADVPVLETRGMLEPGIFGIVRPVLLLPEGILERLTAEQVRAIVAHEMCHVRRRDNLTFAIHMIVEALFWFHPAVWWIGARLIEERERACDEEVLQEGKRPQAYAESILKVCEFCLESPLTCVAGVTGADLKERTVRIISVRLGNKLSLAGKMLLSAVAVVMVAGPLGFGLLHALQANAPLLHATSEPRPSFEVATIKPSNEVMPGYRIDMDPDHFVVKYASVKQLIGFAYYTKSDDQIVGGPSWLSSEFFDVEAKASEPDIAAINKLGFPDRVAQSRLLVQSLLADRFHLRVSFKTEELSVYVLVVAKGGPRLKEVAVSPIPPPGTRPPPGAHLQSIGPTGPNQWTATAYPMSWTVDWLSHFDEVGKRLVVDETGLKGNYDWVLNGVSMAPTPEESTTSIFTALQEQLGLKLVPMKAPVEVLVIDHVEQPSPN